jgi:hypothetical protein
VACVAGLLPAVPEGIEVELQLCAARLRGNKYEWEIMEHGGNREEMNSPDCHNSLLAMCKSFESV